MASQGPIPLAGLLEALRWIGRRRRRLLVRGRSMLPTLAEGDTVLLEPGAAPRVGEVVVARHPFQRDLLLVKRVVAVGPAGRVSLQGDNPAESSHAFGALAPDRVLGVVRSRIGAMSIMSGAGRAV